MKLLLTVLITVATVTLAQVPQTKDEAQSQFCAYCGKKWEDKVPKNWAEITGYLNLACFQLHSTSKPQCMGLVGSLDLNDVYDNFRPKMINVAKSVCGMYC